MRVPFIWTLIGCMTVVPTAIQAADTTEAKAPRLQNVELNESGIVTGRILDVTGTPRVNVPVRIQTPAGKTETRTNASGTFAVSSAAGGNCAIYVEDQAYACRLWKHDTAPPKSLQKFNIVHGQEDVVVRGQGGQLPAVSKEQLIGLGLLAGAVVAIVLAANNDDDDASN